MSSKIQITSSSFFNKKYYIHQFVSSIRRDGSHEFWILNKRYLEIYKFKATQISEFDIQIDLYNELEKEKLLSGIFVLHMKNHILTLLDEVPGIIFINKLDCYRELYASLNNKNLKTKNKKIKENLIEKIDFIENEFPQFII